MVEATTPESRLVRAVGVWALAAGIVNITVGGGIFRLPAGAAAGLGQAAKRSGGAAAGHPHRHAGRG